MARRKKRGKRYVGDQILAAFQAVTGCCGIAGLAFLSAAGFGLALNQSVLSDLKKQMPQDLRLFAKPEMAASLAAFAGLLAIFYIWLTIATWQSKRWSLWANLLLNLAAAVTAGISDNRLSAIVPGLVVIYCSLRVSGAIGPKT